MATPAAARYPDLVGRTVFVSGGGSGIGAAFVAQFAAQGCRVAFIDIADAPSRALAAGLGENVRYLRCDVRDVAALRGAIVQIEGTWGPVRVLINNAARDDRHAVSEVTPEYWDDNLAVYASAKAAIAGLTRVLAREFGERNIRVNSIVPGVVLTERQVALWASPADEKRYLELQCLKFRVSVDDIARTALFLASEESRAITGQSVVVDAGLAQTSYVP
jgi:NAD(P)-dependent dehydrogenase (short-subunit alcohol dehydrogenase family)